MRSTHLDSLQFEFNQMTTSLLNLNGNEPVQPLDRIELECFNQNDVGNDNPKR